MIFCRRDSLREDGKKTRSVVKSAASSYKTTLDPFGFPCWLSEMSKIQEWICLKHNAVKPQSHFFVCFFFCHSGGHGGQGVQGAQGAQGTAVSGCEGEWTASQKCQKAKAFVDPSPGRSGCTNVNRYRGHPLPRPTHTPPHPTSPCPPLKSNSVIG